MAESTAMTKKSTESLSDVGKNGSHKKKEGKGDFIDKYKEDRHSPAKELKHDHPAPEVVSKQGNLWVQTKGRFKKSKHSCFFRLMPDSPSSRARLQQYSNEESAKQKGYQPESFILSTDFISVAPLQEPEHAFVIQHHNESLVLIAEDEVDQKSWIKIIQKVLLSEHQVTYKDIKIPRSFDVYIAEDTQMRIGDDSEVELDVTYGSISIIASTGNLLVRWPIAGLRSFAFDKESFAVTAGRNTAHGEGVYTFKTKQGEEIHRTVKAAKSKEPSFEGTLDLNGVVAHIPEASSPPRPKNSPPNHPPYDTCYSSNCSPYDPIYEPLQAEKIQRFQGSNEPKNASKSRYPTDPPSGSRIAQQSNIGTTSPFRTPSKSMDHTALNSAVYVDHGKHVPFADHTYKNLDTGGTAFLIHPKTAVSPQQPSNEDDKSLYSTVDPNKKTMKRNQESGPSLIPAHKLVSLPHDNNGYTIPSRYKFSN